MLWVSALTIETVREQAQLRIYCDNDPTNPAGRWQLKGDRPNDPYPNSQRHPESQEWIDTLNQLHHFGPMCSTSTSIYATSYKASLEEIGLPVTDLNGRMTITVSDSAEGSQLDG